MRRFVIRRAALPLVAALLVSLFPTAGRADTSVMVQAVPAPPGSPAGKAPAPKITKEQALAIVTGYFGPLNGPGKVEAVQSAYRDHATWEIQYSIQRESMGMTTSLASIDANTGRVLRYSALPPGMRGPRTGPLTPAYPESYARSWAWALVRELYPESASQLALSEDQASPTFYGMPGTPANTYTFTWVLTHDGIPVPSRFVQVTIERDTLNYVDLNQTLMAPLTFTGGPATVAPEQAMQAFAAVKPELSYQVSPPYGPFGTLLAEKPRVALVYSFSALPIAADSGKPVSPAVPEPAPAEPLPPLSGPAEPPAKLPMTQEDAVALVRNLLDAPANAQVRVSPERDPSGSADDLVSIDLFGPGGAYGWASVDLKAGRIRYANRPTEGPGPMQEPGPGPTAGQKEQAKAVAVGLVQRFFPALSSKVRVREVASYNRPGSQSVFTFVFPRYQGDIPVPSNQIFVVIDAATMKMQSISVSWQDDLAFPDPQKAISADAARKLFLDGRKPQLVWLEDQQAGPVPFDPFGPVQPTAMRLAYILSPAGNASNGLLDALTGKPWDWGGQTADPSVDPDKLLAGHRAEGELRYLLDLGVITPAKLNPDAPITRGDALTLLINSRRYPYGGGYYDSTDSVPYTDVAQGSALYPAVQSAIAGGILTPQGEKPTLRPDAEMTRAEFAVWIARSLGLGKLARSGLKLPAPTGLTDPEQRNATAFLEALGILSGGDYTAPLTQADAAAMAVRLIIYNQTP